MQVRLFFCTESTAVDASTNRVSAFHLLEEIGAPAFPATMPQLTVLAIIERGADEPPRAQLQLQAGLENSVNLLVNSPLQVDFQNRLVARVLTVLRGLVIPEPVGLRVALNHNGAEIARWGIAVAQTGQGAAVAPPPAAQPAPTSPSPAPPAPASTAATPNTKKSPAAPKSKNSRARR